MQINIGSVSGPHAGALTYIRDAKEKPRSALLLLHGRGASAENIMRITDRLSAPGDLLVLAPQATGGQWYPNRFLVDRENNEPYLSSALSLVEAIVKHCNEKYDIPARDIILGGFSQGACLVADYAAQKPARYRGICIMSGGLIGSDSDIDSREWQGSFAQTPVYIGCDAHDSHIPQERVRKTSAIYEKLDAKIDLKIYEGLGHAIHPDAYEFLTEQIRL